MKIDIIQRYLHWLIVTLLIFVSSCDEKENVLFEGEKFVAFSTASRNANEKLASVTADGITFESGSQGTVTVYRSTTDFSQPVTVGLTVQSKFLTDSDIANAGDDAASTFNITKDISNLTIPAGEVSASFNIITIDNTEIDGDKSITISIASVSDQSYTIGPKTAIGKSPSFTFTILDDDFFCARNSLANAISTEYDVGYSTGQVKITLVGPEGPCLTFDILGGGGSMFGTADMKISGITLVEDAPESNTGTIAPGKSDLTSLAGSVYSVGGQPLSITILGGVYDLEAGTFEFDYEVYTGSDLYFPGTLQYY